ncbi:hypothetical protein DRO54_06620 [Candidatus Bathyarchaeota archaeon]|nr:MAG: hypothetical protein DRO54_06620 [Candidatus Bathyarchaeota archaeon]
MSFIELLLLESLKRKNPLLDLEGTDKKVLQIAYQDLINYLKTVWNISESKYGAEYEIAERIRKFYTENPEELLDFLDIWAGLWLKKWGERVRLLIGREDGKWRKMNKNLAAGEPLWFQLRNREEFKDYVIKSLIRNGEICGTSILAENLIKMELGASFEKNRFKLNERKNLLILLNNTLKRARELSRSRGPLIFMRIDKRFFQS